MPFSARALLAVFFASCVTASAAFAGTVTGAVRGQETGQPLGSKVVAAYDTGGTLRGSATTDQNGTYVLTLPAGAYRLLAYDNEGVYATAFDGNAGSFETTPVTNVPATGNVSRDFSLATGGYITGRVAGPNGVAQSGATVEVYNLSGTRRAFTTTNAQGTYLIVVPPGEYKVVAYDPSGVLSYSFHRDARSFSESAAVSVAASRTAGGVDFSLSAPGRLSGTVLDAATRTPLGGIDVYAYTASGGEVRKTTTDQAGSFRFTLAPGDYRLVAADPARRYAPGFVGFSSFELSAVIPLRSGEDRTGVPILVARGAKIAGRVVDASGAPVANVTAAAYHLFGALHTTAATDADGRYELLVEPGAYKLVVFDPGLTYATRFFGGVRDFATSGAVGVAAEQRISGFDFSLVRGGRISGIVREGNQPRAGITVAAYDAAGILVASTITNASGAYAMVVPPGDYRLVAFNTELDAPAYVPAYDLGAPSFDQTVPRSIAAGASVTADFSLRLGSVVAGEVVDADGVSISGIEVFALDAAGNRIAGATTGTVDSGFALAVPPGTYKFVAIDPRGRYAVTYYDGAPTLAAARPVEVPNPGVVTRLRFTLEQVMRRRAARH
jgi:large repetitive protein